MTDHLSAVAAGMSEVAVFAAASESFSQRNINCSIAESIDRFKPVLEQAKQDGVKVRGYHLGNELSYYLDMFLASLPTQKKSQRTRLRLLASLRYYTILVVMKFHWATPLVSELLLPLKR